MRKSWHLNWIILGTLLGAVVALALPLAPVATVLAQTATVEAPSATVPPPSAPGAVTSPTATPTPATQNTITTSAPVTSTTTIDVGTYAGQALMWVASVFGTTIGGALTLLIMRMLKNAGIAGSDLLRQRLQEVIVNGLNLGAKQASDALQGRAQVEVHNAIVASAVTYAQAHGVEAIKALGLDPTSPEAVEAIKARIETAIADPAAPTPAVLAPSLPPIPLQP